MDWPIQKYNEMYSDEECVPLFSASYGQFDSYYYNLKNSVTVLEDLLKYQFHDDGELINKFVTDLFNVLERKIPKLNCLCVVSPPSAGKNFFFDAIKDYYLNCGFMGTLNRYNSFPLQDIAHRRVVFWNEPNYSSEKLDELKAILGGDTCTVGVKYSSDVPIYRTPIIVTSNNHCSFMGHPTFADRVVNYNWQGASYLKNFDKKPNPLAIYELFKKYGLV